MTPTSTLNNLLDLGDEVQVTATIVIPDDDETQVIEGTSEAIDGTFDDITPAGLKALAIIPGSTAQTKKKNPCFTTLVGQGLEYCRKYSEASYAVKEAIHEDDYKLQL